MLNIKVIDKSSGDVLADKDCAYALVGMITDREDDCFYLSVLNRCALSFIEALALMTHIINCYADNFEALDFKKRLIGKLKRGLRLKRRSSRK